jgi:hypothetical protein
MEIGRTQLDGLIGQSQADINQKKPLFGGVRNSFSTRWETFLTRQQLQLQENCLSTSYVTYCSPPPQVPLKEKDTENNNAPTSNNMQQLQHDDKMFTNSIIQIQQLEEHTTADFNEASRQTDSSQHQQHQQFYCRPEQDGFFVFSETKQQWRSWRYVDRRGGNFPAWNGNRSNNI